jgi:uncharacterized OsmC-like protein
MESNRWTVRVRSSSGNRSATAYVRRKVVEIGAPLSFDPEYRLVTAFEHLLAAVAGDIVTGFSDHARRNRVTLSGVEAVVQGELENPLAFLGVVGEEGHPGLSSLSIKVFADSTADEASIRRVWEESLRRSPMVNTFRRAVPFEVELELT